MATPSRARTDMTLEEFLRWPRIDRRPYLEYFDDRIEKRISGSMRQSILMSKLSNVLDGFADPEHLGMAFFGLRCTFGKRSIVGDVVFLRNDRIRSDERGQIVEESTVCPDILAEVRSPGESVEEAHARLLGSIADGCPLGWFLDPDRRTIEVFRPATAPERLTIGDHLDGGPVLPGFRIAVSEVFGWLTHRDPGARSR